MTRNPRLVVLDLNGTLVDDGGAVVRTLTSVMTAVGFTVTDADLLRVRGMEKRDAIKALVLQARGTPPPEREVQRLYGAFLNEVQSVVRSTVQPINGAREAIAALHQARIHLAIATGFDRSLAEMILDSHPWLSDLTDALVTGDEVTQGRPAPYLIFHAMERTGTLDARHVVVVGDTPNDVLAGLHARAGRIVAVLTGGQTRPALHLAVEVAVLDSVESLPSLLL